MHRAAAAAALTAALVVPLAGCGDGADLGATEDTGTIGGPVDPATYTAAFCKAFQDFGEALQAFLLGASTAEGADGEGSTSESVIAEYKPTLLKMSDSAASASRVLYRAGYPDFPDGEKLAAEIRRLMRIGPLLTEVTTTIDGLRGSPREVSYGVEQTLLNFVRTVHVRFKSLATIRDREEFATRPADCGP